MKNLNPDDNHDVVLCANSVLLLCFLYEIQLQSFSFMMTLFRFFFSLFIFVSIWFYIWIMSNSLYIVLVNIHFQGEALMQQHDYIWLKWTYSPLARKTNLTCLHFLVQLLLIKPSSLPDTGLKNFISRDEAITQCLHLLVEDLDQR